LNGYVAYSHIEKCINKVVWKTLSWAKHAVEKLAWDGEENEDDDFFTSP
jgi:hypothetical protein